MAAGTAKTQQLVDLIFIQRAEIFFQPMTVIFFVLLTGKLAQLLCLIIKIKGDEQGDEQQVEENENETRQRMKGEKGGTGYAQARQGIFLFHNKIYAGRGMVGCITKLCERLRPCHGQMVTSLVLFMFTIIGTIEQINGALRERCVMENFGQQKK